MTDDQINEVFHSIVGCPARAADLAMLHIFGTSPEDVAEYLWDHWMGEPPNPSLNKVTKQVRQIVQSLTP